MTFIKHICGSCGAEQRRVCWTCTKDFPDPQTALVHHDATGHEISIYTSGGYSVVPAVKAQAQSQDSSKKL